MKLITFSYKKINRLGHLTENNRIVDFASASHGQLPDNIMDFLSRGEYNRLLAKKIAANENLANLPLNKIKILAPIPQPRSLRNGYSLRQHIELHRKNQGSLTEAEHENLPKFYFANHSTITGPGEVQVLADHLDKLDFEMECAAVIGKRGRNIKVENADEYIAGFTIMNDWTARGFQGKEVRFNLGYTKSKDFATSMGPFLVTKDELEMYRIPDNKGDRYDLEMTCSVNGNVVCVDNLQNMQSSFAQIIERASYGVDLMPGDIIGSGTCGTGCFLELNTSSADKDRWLSGGDEVKITVKGLGTLENKIVKIEE